MSAREPIPETLAKVYALGSEMTMQHAWGLLTRDERAAALEELLRDLQAQNRQAFVRYKQRLAAELLSHRGGFRAASIVAWPIERLAQEVSRLRAVKAESIVTGVLLNHHAPSFAAVQAGFFDRLGIPHEQGEAIGELDDVTYTLQQLRDAVRGLWFDQPTMTTGIYLVALATAWRSRWDGLAEVLAELTQDETTSLDQERAESESGNANPAAALSSEDEDASENRPPSQIAATRERPVGRTSQSPRPRPSPRVDSENAKLSALDNELILRAVASDQGVFGAPDDSTMERIVGEFVRLNSLRHQSFFHLGFQDALRAQPPRATLPAANVHRWRWYFAGFVSALWRRERRDEIVALYDAFDVVKELGNTGRGPSRVAADLVARCLIEADRVVDLIEFARPAAIVAMPDLIETLLGFATELQRTEQHETAGALFEHLWSTLVDAHDDIEPQVWEAIQRRFAHCLRMGGQHAAAREMLEGLIDSDDAVATAMVLTDIGLLDAGFGRLADLRLPRGAEARTQMAAALQHGETRFREADALQVKTSSHAHYALGMLALARKSYAEAESLLDSAVAAFDLERARYEPAGLLARARVHLAVSRCANVDTNVVRLPEAVTAIVEGLGEGEQLPDQYLVDVVAGLNLSGSHGAQQAIDKLLNVGGDALLDTVRASSEAVASAAVAEALLQRFRRPNRVSGERVKDGHAVLRMLLATSRFDDATDVFDELEALALDGVGEYELLALTENSALTSILEPWELRNVRVRLSESVGDYDAAALLLEQDFHRVVARAEPDARQTALDLLEIIASYPSCHAVSVDQLRKRLEGASLTVESLPDQAPSRPVHVLVVGGNETQEQYDAAIREHYRECAPWLTIDFLHSGWTSNWDSHLEDFRRRSSKVDALVLIYLMRTEFGRAVRRDWTGVWRGCGGRGRASIQRAIDAATAAVLSMDDQ